MISGILGYGAYVPKYRITLATIAKIWQKAPEEVAALGITEKAVSAFDEDAITMAYEASIKALAMAGIPPTKIDSVVMGSESHPYAVTPSATILGEYLGVGNNYFAADFTFACKAATAALYATIGMIDAKQIQYGLVVGSDAAQAKPKDILEYTAGSGASAFLIGTKKSEIVATILAMTSYSSFTPDFWRREHVRYPSHHGRFTGEPSYFTHVMQCAKSLLEKSKSKPSDFDYCVFHMPNGKFPRAVAKRLGFTEEQLAPSLTVDTIGNSYSATAMLGLSAVLDIAKAGQKIFFVSYGSGAGSDGFLFETTPHLIKKRKGTVPVMEQIKSNEQLSYSEYLKNIHIL